MSKLIRASDQVCIVNDLKVADSYFKRLKGLIGTKKFVAGDGLLFPNCNSVHMWMMSIPIDVVFLKTTNNHIGKKWEIVGVRHQLKPWKLLPVSEFGADDALELPVGVVQSLSLKKGDWLCIA
jgi:uncharacterized membrane protein (UPF0127 family)